MAVGGIMKFIFRRLMEITLIAVILLLVPNLPPHANFSKSLKTVPTKPFTGKLSLNNRLDDVELWHKGDFIGPEGLAELNGELYTSLYTGDIVKLTGEHITPIVKFGKPCKESYEESICGRPLGIEFDRNGYLIAADAYYGIFKVDVKTGKKEQLVSPSTVIEGRKPKLFNGIALASNGDIYWTDSSSEFSLEDGVFSLLADPSGRLIHYNAKTKTNKVLIDEIHFANGVVLSDDEEFVIVSETAANRIQKYYLKGSKKGKKDIFIDGLPGLPDNLRSDGKGGFFVPLVYSVDADYPNLFQTIRPFPLLRKAIARFLGVTEYLFRKIDELYPNDLSLKAMHFIGHFTSMPSSFRSSRTTILRLDKNGQITDSVHSFNNKIGSFCDVKIFRDNVYLGSPFNDYLARIPLSKVGWEDLRKDERIKRAAPVETPKPTTTTTEKPTTTTTARPTTTQRLTTTTQRPTTTTTARPSTTQRPTTTTTPKPTTTTPPPTTTQKPTTTTQKPTTTTQKPTATTPKPTTAKTAPPAPKQAPAAQQKTLPPPVKQQNPPQAKQTPSQQTQTKEAPTQPKQAPPQQAQPKQVPSQAKQAPPQAQKVPQQTQQQKQQPPVKPAAKAAQSNKK